MNGRMPSRAVHLWPIAILAPLALASCGQLKNSPQAASAPAATQVSATPAPAAVPAPPKDVPTRLAVALVEPGGTSQPGQTAAMTIARQISDCWVSDQPSDPPVVPVQLLLNRDGTVRSVTVLDKTRFAGDAGFRAAAREVTTAFFKCSPFVLPAASYADWKSLALRVTPYHV